MTVYVCLDDRNGMLFNKRRQSRDAKVLEDIRASISDVLIVDPFSETLIRDAGIPYVLAGSSCGFFVSAAIIFPLYTNLKSLYNKSYENDNT